MNSLRERLAENEARLRAAAYYTLAIRCKRNTVDVNAFMYWLCGTTYATDTVEHKYKVIPALGYALLAVCDGDIIEANALTYTCRYYSPRTQELIAKWIQDSGISVTPATSYSMLAPVNSNSTN